MLLNSIPILCFLTFFFCLLPSDDKNKLERVKWDRHFKIPFVYFREKRLLLSMAQKTFWSVYSYYIWNIIGSLKYPNVITRSILVFLFCCSLFPTKHFYFTLSIEHLSATVIRRTSVEKVSYNFPKNHIYFLSAEHRWKRWNDKIYIWDYCISFLKVNLHLF